MDIKNNLTTAIIRFWRDDAGAWWGTLNNTPYAPLARSFTTDPAAYLRAVKLIQQDLLRQYTRVSVIDCREKFGKWGSIHDRS
jgi:hypothetical protein